LPITGLVLVELLGDSSADVFQYSSCRLCPKSNAFFPPPQKLYISKDLAYVLQICKCTDGQYRSSHALIIRWAKYRVAKK